MTYRFGGVELSGINKFKGKHKGETAVICCSGTTFENYDNDLLPPHWTRFAVNEAIRKTSKYADFWVLSDNPIIFEYKEFCRKDLKCLVMRQATHQTKHLPSKHIFTVDSMAEPKNFGNGYQFYSRGTVMIGAIEMARFMGFTRFFCFGLDCFRTADQYYYDRRRPAKFTENKVDQREMVRSGVPTNVQIYVTSLLRKMINRMELGAPLWREVEIYCVDSPLSQQTVVPKMTLDGLKALIKKEKEHTGRESKDDGKAIPASVPASLRTKAKAAKADGAGPVLEGGDEPVGEADASSDSGAGRRKVRRKPKTDVPGAGDTAGSDDDINGSGSTRPAVEKLLHLD